MPQRNDSGYFRVDVRCHNADFPSFGDIIYFLQDFNLLYEFSRIVEDPHYREYRFSRFSTYRNRRRISPDDQLIIERLSQESPLEIEFLLTTSPLAAGALWALVQVLEKIYNIPIDHQN